MRLRLQRGGDAGQNQQRDRVTVAGGAH
jgi:hypothetical protein